MSLRNPNGDQRIMTRQTISSKMRIKPRKEKLNPWPLAVAITESPHLTSTIGSATLSETTYKETSSTTG